MKHLLGAMKEFKEDCDKNYNHPCKETCSGWKQEFEKGIELGVQACLEELRSETAVHLMKGKAGNLGEYGPTLMSGLKWANWLEKSMREKGVIK